MGVFLLSHLLTKNSNHISFKNTMYVMPVVLLLTTHTHRLQKHNSNRINIRLNIGTLFCTLVFTVMIIRSTNFHKNVQMMFQIIFKSIFKD